MPAHDSGLMANYMLTSEMLNEIEVPSEMLSKECQNCKYCDLNRQNNGKVRCRRFSLYVEKKHTCDFHIRKGTEGED